jgi:hypothetical protein
MIIAGLYGMADDLSEYFVLRAAQGQSNDTGSFHEMYELEKKIRHRLEMAFHETETVARYLECEEDYFDYLQEQVDLENDKEDSKLTKVAILAGAVTSAVIGVILVVDDQALNDSNATDWLGVIGGGVGAYFAVKSARINNQVIIEHPYNPLKNIWENDNSDGIYPETLWTLLNLEFNDGNEGGTIRQNIADHCQSILDRYDPEESDELLALLLGSGGTYSSEALNIRAQMLEQASEDIERIVDAVRLLLIEIG